MTIAETPDFVMIRQRSINLYRESIMHNNSVRLFFALWPDQATRVAIAETAGQSGLDPRRLLPNQRLHLTLIFLGNVTVARTQVLIEKTAQITVPRFSLCLDRSGWWEGSQILWLGPASVPEELRRLYRQIHQLAVELAIPVPERPYQPHITLARKVNAGMAFQFEPVHWNVRDFCLVVSNTLPDGAEYQIIQRWPLT